MSPNPGHSEPVPNEDVYLRVARYNRLGIYSRGCVPAGLAACVGRAFCWRPQCSTMAPSAVEGFFAILAKRTLGRSVFRSVAGPQAAINRFREEHNRQSRPFAWAAGRDKTIAAVRRGRQVLDSIH